MQHRLKLLSENMYGLLEYTFAAYANQLRAKYPGRKIRNAEVFASAIQAFAGLGYIELADAKAGIREGIPDFLVDSIRRSRHQPIWIPGKNFPVDPSDLDNEMQPYMCGDAILWRHTPSECRRISRLKNIDDGNQRRTS